MATTAPSLHTALSNSPYAFLQPAPSLHSSSLSYLKDTLDPLATSISQDQQARLQQSRRKRKRGQNVGGEEDVLRLKKVHIQGFAIEQVWEQARRVIDAARKEAERGLAEVEARQAESSEDEEDLAVEKGLDGESVDGEDESDLGEEGVDYEIEGEDVDGEEVDDIDGMSEDDLDGVDAGDVDMEDEEEALEDEEPAQEFVVDPHGLNDGFFSIDDFNRQSDFLEQADARGDNDGADSDEEDIDWGADPTGASAQAAAGTVDQDMDDEEDDEDGPTFGNTDLNAREGDSEDDNEEIEDGEMDDMGSMANTNNVMYAEFFAPPAKKASKKKRGRPNPHNFPAAQEPPSGANDPEENEADIERTMSAVHRDLFEDESEDEGADEVDNDLDPSDPKSRRSTHERKKAALAEEIRRLEAANVAKREWTLSGEARAADRPINSLLEEDLEFERAGKPVPVITAEVSEDIEELIKRRILAQDFDDIIRRRPNDLATGKDARRGRLDYHLDDTKAKQSLAEQYEEEHLRKTDPNFVEASDEKTRKEQAEITALWKDISGKLDSLSSWHFRPKAPAPQLDIRVDAPVVSLEDARPSAGADAAGASQLAPQEVYKAGEAREKAEEVVTRGGMPVGREEMSREERRRRRRRDKERIRKASSNDEKKPESKKSKDKKDMLVDLKRGGATVIGKKGELQDVEGNAVGERLGAQGAGSFKL